MMGPAGKDNVPPTEEALNATIHEMKQFLNMATHTTFVSMPSYDIDKMQYHKMQSMYVNMRKDEHINRINDGLRESSTVKNHPFIDVFSLTKACNWANCSYDGGHR